MPSWQKGCSHARLVSQGGVVQSLGLRGWLARMPAWGGRIAADITVVTYFPVPFLPSRQCYKRTQGAAIRLLLDLIEQWDPLNIGRVLSFTVLCTSCTIQEDGLCATLVP